MGKPAAPLFVCRQCDYQSAKWLGRCPECASWDSFAEQAAPVANVPAGAPAAYEPYPEISTAETQWLQHTETIERAEQA